MHFSLPLLVIVYASQAMASATYDVQVGYSSRLEFFPNQLTVAPGDTVRFKFMAGTHTVTMEQPGQQCQAAPSALFDYRQATGSTAEFVFHDEGTFGYFCAIGDHCQKGMRGTVTVSAAGGGGAGGGAGPGGATTPPGASTNAGAPGSTAATNATGAPTTALSNGTTTTNGTSPVVSNGTLSATNGTNGTNATGNYAAAAGHMQWWLTLGAGAMVMAWL